MPMRTPSEGDSGATSPSAPAVIAEIVMIFLRP
jgi:hypothetical protein